ncbi:unnamed protein product [Darwinula stevensoni]|uniref:Uncharacterized protein n=1 Tax=Darwinula stevensoni TaxID=69355 RepID=A0A7R9A876_9CRUS|nr:unnamed protein product [Darwinula stevensoni]CAG0896129.1 unnamed protein product [Darwinula stevensoni]
MYMSAGEPGMHDLKRSFLRAGPRAFAFCMNEYSTFLLHPPSFHSWAEHMREAGDILSCTCAGADEGSGRVECSDATLRLQPESEGRPLPSASLEASHRPRATRPPAIGSEDSPLCILNSSRESPMYMSAGEPGMHELKRSFLRAGPRAFAFCMNEYSTFLLHPPSFHSWAEHMREAGDILSCTCAGADEGSGRVECSDATLRLALAFGRNESSTFLLLRPPRFHSWAETMLDATDILPCARANVGIGTSGLNLCPNSTEILPCTCSYFGTEDTVMVDCSEATSSDDIYSAFNDVAWPVQNLKRFLLGGNCHVSVLPEGAFGDISFEEIVVIQTSVASLHPTALLPSKDRLRRLTIEKSFLEELPWEILPQLINLKKLELRSNALNSLPKLQSGHNPVLDVPAGFFNDMGKLEEFYCFSCTFGPTLSTKSLEFRSATMKVIHIDSNSISTLDADAITGLQPNTSLYFGNNEIRELTEVSFRPMLEVLSVGTGHISIRDNPVKCDCSIAWVVLNPSFLGSLQGECTDGTNFQDLDPIIFEDCARSEPNSVDDYSTWIDYRMK